jgi:hypothetical protein
MMPPLPPLPEPDGYLDGFRGMPGWSREQVLAYGRAVAEACAALVEQYAADPDVTDGIAAAIRALPVED